MMYEDSYPFFQKTYRLLSKEGVTFPPRQTSTRFMLSSLGLESPMFEYLDEISQKNEPKNSSLKPKEPIFNESKAIDKANKEFTKFTGGAIELVNRETNESKLALVSLSPSDIESIKNYMEIIDDICVNAEDISELKTDIAAQMYKYCQSIYTRCINIIDAKVAHDVEFQLEILLSLSEDLSMRIKLFQNMFIDLTIKTEAKAAGIDFEKYNKEKQSSLPNQEEKKEVKKKKLQVKPLPPPPSNQFFQFDTKQKPLVDLLDNFDDNEEKKTKPEIKVQENDNIKEDPKNEVKKIASDLLDLELDDNIQDGIDKQSIPETQNNPEVKKQPKSLLDDDFFDGFANEQ